ncbi:MAG TPA: hypothetical protein VEY09_10220 [Pyrinomonadaceae bacterium]|nr:hypothetical protein [Pyrinomonadaceae bacterium]
MFGKSRFARGGLAALVLGAALAAPASTIQPAASAQGQGRRADSALVARAERVTGDQFRFETSTPMGARVVAVSRQSPAVLRAVDQGLSELFAAARRRGYRQALDHSQYTIFVGRADRTRDSAGAYSPDIAVGAAQYRGSVYDQGGYVYAAGMVLSMSPPAFVIAEHERDFGRVANVARYEGEHIVLYHNDRRLYSETMDHSRGGSHPIIQ